MLASQEPLSSGTLPHAPKPAVLTPAAEMPPSATLLNDDEFADFRDFGGVRLSLSSDNVSSVSGRLILRLAEDDLKQLDISTVQAGLERQDDGSWFLSVTPDHDSTAWAMIRTNLVQVGLIINSGDIQILHEARKADGKVATPYPDPRLQSHRSSP